MPRFVILEHDFPVLHWDFMLESKGVLLTWRLPHPPHSEGIEMTAEAIGDHRSAYLDYEGPVSGNRGKVTRWDFGTYETQAGPSLEEVVAKIKGGRLTGTVRLNKGPESWKFAYWPESNLGIGS